jgi:hypothetical protein
MRVIYGAGFSFSRLVCFRFGFEKSAPDWIGSTGSPPHVTTGLSAVDAGRQLFSVDTFLSRSGCRRATRGLPRGAHVTII